MDNKCPTCVQNLKKKKKKQRYKYIRENSIVLNFKDEYKLLHEEYFLLYSFFVTYSMCGTQSGKKKNFIDYGWEKENLSDNKELVMELRKIIDLNDGKFVFTDEDNLKEEFQNNKLTDGKLLDYKTERCVIAKTNETNKYLKLFYRIRDGLAHGKFYLKREQNERMVIIQDDDTQNVTAIIVIKLQTLLDIIRVVARGHSLAHRDMNWYQTAKDNLKKTVG